MSITHDDIIGYCTVHSPGSAHHGAEGTVIKAKVYPTHTSLLVCINTGSTQGAAVWLNKGSIRWDKKTNNEHGMNNSLLT